MTHIKLKNLLIMATEKNPLIFNIIAECSTTKARTSNMILPHHKVDTPVFMPVGTQVKQCKFLPFDFC